MSDARLTIRYRFPAAPSRLTGQTVVECTSPLLPYTLVLAARRSRRKNADGTWRVVCDAHCWGEYDTWDEAVRVVHQHAYAYLIDFLEHLGGGREESA